MKTKITLLLLTFAVFAMSFLSCEKEPITPTPPITDTTHHTDTIYIIDTTPEPDPIHHYLITVNKYNTYYFIDCELYSDFIGQEIHNTYLTYHELEDFYRENRIEWSGECPDYPIDTVFEIEYHLTQTVKHERLD